MIIPNSITPGLSKVDPYYVLGTNLLESVMKVRLDLIHVGTNWQIKISELNLIESDSFLGSLPGPLSLATPH